MRKGCRVLPAAVLLAAVLAGAGLMLRNSQAPARVRPEELDTRDITARYLPDESVLAVTQTMTVTNRSEDKWDDLMICSPAFLSGADPETGAAFGGIRIQNARAGESFLSPAVEGENALFALPQPLESGGQVTLTIRYLLDIPAGDAGGALFGDDGTAVRLCRVFPVPAVRKDGAWTPREETTVGDNWYAEPADYTFSLELPDGCALSAPGKTQRQGNRVSGAVFSAEDLCLVIWKTQVQEAAASAGGVRVTVSGREKASLSRTANRLSALAGKLAGLYGPCPMGDIAVCILPGSGPIALPGMILLDSGTKEPWEGADVPYLMAWQWFGAGFSCDRSQEGWTADALSEWAGLRALRLERGAAAYELRVRSFVDEAMRESRRLSLTPGSPLSAFDDESVLESVRRGRGCAFLTAADTLSGGRLDAFLSSLMESAGKWELSGPGLLGRMNDYFAEDFTPLYLDYIHTYM